MAPTRWILLAIPEKAVGQIKLSLLSLWHQEDYLDKVLVVSQKEKFRKEYL